MQKQLGKIQKKYKKFVDIGSYPFFRLENRCFYSEQINIKINIKKSRFDKTYQNEKNKDLKNLNKLKNIVNSYRIYIISFINFLTIYYLYQVNFWGKFLASVGPNKTIIGIFARPIMCIIPLSIDIAKFNLVVRAVTRAGDVMLE